MVGGVAAVKGRGKRGMQEGIKGEKREERNVWTNDCLPRVRIS